LSDGHEEPIAGAPRLAPQMHEPLHSGIDFAREELQANWRAAFETSDRRG
jgi:hypothetical protein